MAETGGEGMSVYIQGMEMPTDCSNCELAQHFDGYNENECPFNAFSFHDCPLISVPDHGRLIDADALWVKIHDICDSRDAGVITDLTCIHQILSALRHAPTIIPASEV